MWGGKGSALAGAGPTACHRSRDRPQPFANWATAPSSECRHHCRCHSQPLSSTSLIPLVPNRIYPCVPAGRKLPATNDDCLRQSGVRACRPLGSQRRSIHTPQTHCGPWTRRRTVSAPVHTRGRCRSPAFRKGDRPVAGRIPPAHQTLNQACQPF